MKFKKNLAMGIIASAAFSPLAFADNQGAGSSLVSLSVGEIKAQSVENAKMDMMIQSKQQELKLAEINKQIRILQQEGEKESYDKKIKDLEDKWTEEKSALIESHKKEIEDLKKSFSKVENRESTVSTNEEISVEIKDKYFVTMISGIGSKMRAKIYSPNSVTMRKVGDELEPGLKITSIGESGVKLKNESGLTILTLTSPSFAKAKSFENLTQSQVSPDMGLDKTTSPTDSIIPNPFL